MSDDLPAFAPDFGRAPPLMPPAPWRPDLRAWRVARGWSQFEAAKQTGISLSTWIRWETKGVPELRRARVREMLK